VTSPREIGEDVRSWASLWRETGSLKVHSPCSTSADMSRRLSMVSDAVRLVLLHYLQEGELARRRCALTSTVSALRDREIASVARYQRLFREFIASWMTDTAESAPLRAEVMAAAVVAAHNHVLRRWLRGESPDPAREVGEAMEQVIGSWTDRPVLIVKSILFICAWWSW
jgi:AcrR family transcriptional regulator